MGVVLTFEEWVIRRCPVILGFFNLKRYEMRFSLTLINSLSTSSTIDVEKPNNFSLTYWVLDLGSNNLVFFDGLKLVDNLDFDTSVR